MESSEKQSLHAPTTPQPSAETAGVLFPDGSALERLADGQLIWAKGPKQTFGRNLRYHDTQYQAAPISPDLERTLRVPNEVKDFGSTAQLDQQLSDAVSQHVGLDGHEALLVSTYVLATHLAGAIPLPWLNLTGTADPVPLLQFLSAVCRHPLPLSEPSLRDLTALPAGLTPTLVLHQPALSFVRRLETATTVPGFGFLRGGQISSLTCTAVVYSRHPLPVPALVLPRFEGNTATVPVWLPSRQLEEIALTFQPQLYQFRLRNWFTAANSQIPTGGFTPGLRKAVRALAATLTDAPELQCRLLELLQKIDGENRLVASTNLNAVVLEALLDLIHCGATTALVHTVADNSNGLLVARHELPQLTAKKVGTILRDEFGLQSRRAADGYHILLERQTCARIHQYAEEYGVAGSQPAKDCSFCIGDSEDELT